MQSLKNFLRSVILKKKNQHYYQFYLYRFPRCLFNYSFIIILFLTYIKQSDCKKLILNDRSNNLKYCQCKCNTICKIFKHKLFIEQNLVFSPAFIFNYIRHHCIGNLLSSSGIALLSILSLFYEYIMQKIIDRRCFQKQALLYLENCLNIRNNLQNILRPEMK